jgi:spore photoproduct lyase
MLAPTTRSYLRERAKSYRFTYQELRRVSQAARDLEMWREDPIEIWWEKQEARLESRGRERKKRILRDLDDHLQQLAASEKSYPEQGLVAPPRRNVRLREVQTEKKVFGLCPAYSEHTVCCGLHTIDAVRGCPFSCSYCTIQTFYGESAELESDLLEKLSAIQLDPDRRYHIGTGQSSDSLVWGNRQGLLDALIEFAEMHPNVLLELKTKSSNIGPLLARDVPPNVVCTWSLGTPTTIRNEEPGTATLDQRLRAARQTSDYGIDIGFHFHPMIYYSGWRSDYAAVAARLLAEFRPSEISFVSMGAVTLIRPVEREIRKRGGQTKILQMDMVQDAHGKLTYPDAVKIELFSHLYDALDPWHGEVFFYLCMENASIWTEVFGRAYPTNRGFEDDFLNRCLRQTQISKIPS